MVILGAGLDARAFRLGWPDKLRVFEIDLPRVLEFKEQVVRAEGWRPSCERIIVPVDLSEDWSRPLVRRRVRRGHAGRLAGRGPARLPVPASQRLACRPRRRAVGAGKPVGPHPGQLPAPASVARGPSRRHGRARATTSRSGALPVPSRRSSGSRPTAGGPRSSTWLSAAASYGRPLEPDAAPRERCSPRRRRTPLTRGLLRPPGSLAGRDAGSLAVCDAGSAVLKDRRAGLLGRPGPCRGFEGRRDRTVQLGRAVKGSSQRFERVEHDLEAGALAGVVDPYDRAGELAEARRERHVVIGPCAFDTSARASVPDGAASVVATTAASASLAYGVSPSARAPGAACCRGRAMAPLHALQALGQHALERGFEGEDLEWRRRAGNGALVRVDPSLFPVEQRERRASRRAGIVGHRTPGAVAHRGDRDAGRPCQGLLRPDHGDVDAPVVEPHLVRAGGSHDVDQHEGTVLAGERCDGRGVVADSARRLDVDEADDRDLGVRPQRPLDRLRRRRPCEARRSIPITVAPALAKPVPDGGAVRARVEVERGRRRPGQGRAPPPRGARTASAWGRTTSRRVSSSEATARAEPFEAGSRGWAAGPAAGWSRFLRSPSGARLVAEMAGREVLRVACRPARDAGCRGLHISSARGQRGWNEQPVGMSIGLGGSPLTDGPDELDLVQARARPASNARV